MDDLTEVYVEWRVTADTDRDFPDYDFTWSPFLNPHLGDPERAARGFAALAAEQGSLRNVKLMRRTVAVEPWELSEESDRG